MEEPEPIAAVPLSKTQVNRAKRREHKQEQLLLTAAALEALARPSSCAAQQLSSLHFLPLDSTRAAAALPAMAWSEIPPALDLGSDNSPQALGWIMTGKGDSKRAERGQAPPPHPNSKPKKRKIKHLANFSQRVAEASASGAAVPEVHERVLRKRMQVESFAAILAVLESASEDILTIVDFGAAAGTPRLKLHHPVRRQLNRVALRLAHLAARVAISALPVCRSRHFPVFSESAGRKGCASRADECEDLLQLD